MRHENAKNPEDEGKPKSLRTPKKSPQSAGPSNSASETSTKRQRISPLLFERPTKCVCRCRCGFYGPEVELTSASRMDSSAAVSMNSTGVPQMSASTFAPVDFGRIHRNLCPQDQFLLSELCAANTVLKAPMELSLQELDLSAEISLITVVRITDLAMRRIIAMAKQLSAFRQIDQMDQIALLKGGLSELLILRGVMVFDPAHDAWTHNIFSGSRPIRLSVDVLKKTPAEEHYEVHKNFLRTFDERWRQNEEVMLILNGIALFSPDRPNIRDVALVKGTQQLYANLLERYLRTECSATEATEVYSALMWKMSELREVNTSIQRVYNRLNPDDLEPLLKELFAQPPLPKFG